MAFNILETNKLRSIAFVGFVCSILSWIVCNFGFLHFFVHCVAPKVIAILSIESQSFLSGLWQSYAKLVSRSPVFLLDFVDHSVALLYDKRNPPSKGRLLWDFVSNSIFSKFNGIAIFQILKVKPLGSAVSPFGQQLPANSGLLWHLEATGLCDIAIVLRHGSGVLSVIGDFLKYPEFSTFIITLSPKVFSNNVSKIFVSGAIFKLNFIFSRVKHWIMVRCANRAAIDISSSSLNCC